MVAGRWFDDINYLGILSMDLTFSVKGVGYFYFFWILSLNVVRYIEYTINLKIIMSHIIVGYMMYNVQYNC